jgi:glycosyltransferase involved in cell wall biosynthesis
MGKKLFTVACIPAYNEERTIAQVILKTMKHVDRVIVCNDGSHDMTGEIAERLGAEVVYHETNEGYGSSLCSLFRRARELDANIIVTLDADGQHDPGDIPVLVKPILEGSADVVIGSRFLNKNDAREVPFYRRLGIETITKLTNTALNDEVRDAQSGFRAYDRRALEGLKLFESGMGISVEVLLKAAELGLGIVEVPVGCVYRGLGKTSKQGVLSHGLGVVMSIVKLVVEERPLIFLGVPGAVSLLAGVLFGVWMLQIYASEHHIVTNIALASLAFILIGLFAVFTAITLYAISRSTQKAINRY